MSEVPGMPLVTSTGTTAPFSAMSGAFTSMPGEAAAPLVAAQGVEEAEGQHDEGGAEAAAGDHGEGLEAVEGAGVDYDRTRLEVREALDVIVKAWTEEILEYKGQTITVPPRMVTGSERMPAVCVIGAAARLTGFSSPS